MEMDFIMETPLTPVPENSVPQAGPGSLAEIRDLLLEERERSKKRLLHSRIRTAAALVAAIVALFVLLQAGGLVTQASDMLEEASGVVEEAAQVDLVRLSDSLQAFIDSTNTEMTLALRGISGINFAGLNAGIIGFSQVDFAALNDSIRSLSTVVGGMSRLFGGR